MVLKFIPAEDLEVALVSLGGKDIHSYISSCLPVYQ